MSERWRGPTALLAAAAVCGLLLWGMTGLPPVGRYRGPYGDLLLEAAPRERAIQNVVTAVNFDYRALDTLGEEFILFTAVAGTSLLLRRLRAESEDQSESDVPDEARTDPGDALRAWGLAVVACTLLFGLYVVAHAAVSPGGGFQGGCILASAWLVVYLSGNFPLLERVTTEHGVQLAEALGAGAYAAIGLAGLLLGGTFLENMLPLDSPGSPLSGGMVALVNAAVGLEVTAGFVLILLEFFRQTIKIREGGP